MFHKDGRGRSAGRAAFASEVAGGDIRRPHMDRARWPSAGLAASGAAGGDRRFHIDAPAPRSAARGFSIAGGLTQPQTELQDDAAFVHRAVRENKRKLRFMDQKARASVRKKWNEYIEEEGARAAAWNQPDPIQKIHVEHWARQLDDRVRDAREKGIPVPSRELGKRFVKGQYIIC